MPLSVLFRKVRLKYRNYGAGNSDTSLYPMHENDRVESVWVWSVKFARQISSGLIHTKYLVWDIEEIVKISLLAHIPSKSRSPPYYEGSFFFGKTISGN